MRISTLLKGEKPTISFEFFPPKTDAGRESLIRAIERLAVISPDFVSVTYGAGGSTRALSFDLCKEIKGHVAGEVMSHLTSMCHTKEDIGEIGDLLWGSGIVNIMALRGDMPKNLEADSVFSDFQYAKDMISFLKSSHDFCLGGACFPEGHKETPDIKVGIEHLRQKIDSGCEFLVTQMFFDNDGYFRFVNAMRDAGINVPVIPGIMPITGFAQLDKFEQQFGVQLPSKLRDMVKSKEGDEDAIEQTGIEWSAQQCRELLDKGAPGIHFYTLNKSASTIRVCVEMGLSGRSAALGLQ